MVVHLNNVAGIGPLLVEGLRERGLAARMVEAPGGDLLRRQLRRWRTFRAEARRSSLAHVHYALYAAYLERLDVPMVVHCHGSDIVPNLGRPILGRLTCRGLQSARKVLYSTANLAGPLKERSIAATFLPNPVVIRSHTPDPEPNSVLLFSRLDPIKGAATLLATGRRLADQGVKVRVINWGALAADVEQNPQGIEVLERVHPDEVPALIARHQVILGQMAARVCGVSELQAMASQRPVVMPYGTWDDEPVGPPVVHAETAEEAAGAVLGLLADPRQADRVAQAGYEWVKEHHAVDKVVDRLLAIYEEAGLL